MDNLVQHAVEAASSGAAEEAQVFASNPPSPPPAPPRSRPLKCACDADDGLNRPGPKRTCLTNANETPKAQSSNNRRRSKRRAEKRETHGHPCGSGRAFEKYVLPSAPVETELQGEELPIAEGGWIAANASYYGAKVKRNLEDMKAKGFTHIPWQGK